MIHASELPVEVIHTNWLYQTAIDDIRVTVRMVDSDYHITVERTGKIAATYCIDDQVKALTMADILRDVFYSKLDADLLWH